MAALQPALSSSVPPALSIGQDNGAQQVGVEGRDKSDIGIPFEDANWGEGPLLQSPEVNATPELYGTPGDLYPPEVYSEPLDQTPYPYYQGDPDRDDDPYNDITVGDYDQGAPASNRYFANPDIGKPILNQFRTHQTDQQPVFMPEGYMVEVTDDRTAPVLAWWADQDVGVVYIQEDERPLYNQVAQVPAEYEGPGGLYQPDNRYSEWKYNDAGIPAPLVSTPDPPVSPVPDQAGPADPMYLDGF